MSIELDHIFICSDVNAPEADKLREFGLAEGASNIHHGQGTANRRFYFHNAMLELLWVDKFKEVQSIIVRPLNLWKRWEGRKSGSCPFGFCFRSTSNPVDDAPFTSWNYHPPYSPDSLPVVVAANSEKLTEPMLFYIPHAVRPDTYERERSQPLLHSQGLSQITGVELSIPNPDDISGELKAVTEAGLIELRMGTDYLIKLEFDRELLGRQADFRPGLPLILSW